MSKTTFAHIEINVETILGLIRDPRYGDYQGSIIFLGFYNPYPLIFPGSDVLQAILTVELERSVVKFGAKYVNPIPVFNPSPEGGRREQRRIGGLGMPGRYTEMGNQHQIELNDRREAEEGKPETHKGDIHPTVAGYAALARLLFASYP